ncbi:DUF6310 domain-containing protein [Stigmatella sp. ncwal1]|uniref:DUF6310 domain-containing protein n=2 Tax=Stigmatella ashevillensis TaxID=2995309 RepID=A0ABT5DFU6_9BACT|nr:DUF6310 domain-containing protein [Stigmatella ashevillena]
MVEPDSRKQQEPETKPGRSGPNRGAPIPPTSESRPECIPRIVPHLGGDALHNKCADKVPQNGFPGFDAFVNGKHFDALQHRSGVLWEVKTDNFDTYSRALREIVIGKQIPELRRERDLARACGFNFRVGVRSAEHKLSLEELEPSLDIVVMDWC